MVMPPSGAPWTLAERFGLLNYRKGSKMHYQQNQLVKVMLRIGSGSFVWRDAIVISQPLPGWMVKVVYEWGYETFEAEFAPHHVRPV